MRYLDHFSIPDERAETDYIVNQKKLDMECYHTANVHPFKLFPRKELAHIDFSRSPITIFYGSNGSGKSTLLNIIAGKLRLYRTSPFNRTPFFEDYLGLCRAGLPCDAYGREKTPPAESCIITSDDVFDFMLNLRAINAGVDADRERTFAEWDSLRKDGFQMRSLADYDELVRHTEATHRTRSEYTARRVGKNIPGQSNGESAMGYFADRIRGHALYLLDEPENSLSAERQIELSRFLEDSARFYECQFIISTHSPFLLAMHGATVYDLDTPPVSVRRWTELSNVRIYHDFFEEKRGEFEKERELFTNKLQ